MPLQVSFTAKGGHSSMPPTDATSVGAIMGRVLTRLERHQLPPWLPQSMVEQLQVRHACACLAEQPCTPGPGITLTQQGCYCTAVRLMGMPASRSMHLPVHS